MTPNLYQRAKRNVRGVALAGLAGLSLAGCDLTLEQRDITRDEFNRNRGAVYLVYPQRDSSYTIHAKNEYIEDVDNDGLADVIGSMGRALWVAPGYKETLKSITRTEEAQIMTPEIREAATRALKSDQDLLYLIAKSSYELQEAKKAQRGSQ